MPSVAIEIVRYTDDHQPGWVECRLRDVHGHDWLFVEKVPLVTSAYLDIDSDYPRPGSIGVTVLKRSGDRLLVGVSPIDDYRECEVLASSVTDD